MNDLLKMMFSMLIWGSIGLLKRMIPLDSSFIAFVRGLLGSIFILCFLLFKKKARDPVSKKNLFLLSLSGILMGFNWVLLFKAYDYTTVATATLCYYMEPTLLILVSLFVFKEKLTKKKLFCTLLALIGMILISDVLNTGFTWSEYKGVLFGLSAAFLYAMVVTINRLVDGVDAYQKTLIQLGSSSLAMLVFLFMNNGFSGLIIDTRTGILLLIMGIVYTGLPYVLYFGSIGNLKTEMIALCSYIDPITALVLSAIVLNEPFGLIHLIGSCLILGSAYIAQRE